MRSLHLPVAAILCLASSASAAPATQPAYHFYSGNTHAHTAFTWSHGEQWVNPNKGAGGGGGADVHRVQAEGPVPADRPGRRRAGGLGRMGAADRGDGAALQG